MEKDSKKVVIIGAGAAGFFTAINLASLLSFKKIKAKITILEKSTTGLRKVRISGGGRCNVTHYQAEIKEFLINYPRGNRQLRAPFYNFSSLDTQKWFHQRGVKLKTEADGRIFPVSNSSQSIIECFHREIQKFNIDIIYKTKIDKITKKDDSFIIETNHSVLESDALCIATGSDPSGHKLAQSLGHSITDLAPSLFTFKVQHPLLKNLSGTSFKDAQTKIIGLPSKVKLQEQGALLITHWGLSGPSILKISAWGARELKKINYRFKFKVNFVNLHLDQAREKLELFKRNHKKKQIGTIAPLRELTQKFWHSLLKFHNIDLTSHWANLSQKQLNQIALCLTAQEFESTGPHRHKEEFVECGGVSSEEIDFKTMQSKIKNNLYFAGELLDIDGITGGFNFQNAWSTSHQVASSIFEKLTPN